MEVDAYGAFNTPGVFGSRPHIGFGIVNPVDVHFVGSEDTGAGTVDIYVIEDSSNDVLAHVVVVLDSLVSSTSAGSPKARRHAIIQGRHLMALHSEDFGSQTTCGRKPRRMIDPLDDAYPSTSPSELHPRMMSTCNHASDLHPGMRHRPVARACRS
jgi:hypothetical protein